MKLVLATTFKSLTPLEVILPDFVVLTGLNGAGKTQLLSAIANNHMSILDENGLALGPVKYTTAATLAPNESIVATKEHLTSQTQTLWINFQQTLSRYLHQKQVNYPPQNRRPSLLGVSETEDKAIRQIAKSSLKKSRI